MSDQSYTKRLIKRVILWSVIVGGILALFVPMHAQSVPIRVSAQATDPCATFSKNGNDRCIGDTETSAKEIAEGNTAQKAGEIVLSVVKFLIAISGIITVVMLCIGGYFYILSAGDQARAKQGLDTIKNALIGFVIVLLAFGVVTLVESLVLSI